MFRIPLCAAVISIVSAFSVFANDVENTSFVMPEGSGVFQNWQGRTALTLNMSAGVPFRVFTLDDPARLVVDFRGLDWSRLSKNDLADANLAFDTVHFGAVANGWSRFVGVLKAPGLPQNVEMKTDDLPGGARLRIEIVQTTAERFAKRAGVPETALWSKAQAPAQPAPIADDQFVVMLDPGHGGIDPGAERAGLSEKNLMLDLARDLSVLLKAQGDVAVFLTRQDDVFVSLQSRVAQAHQVGADVFLSLHADALASGGARGATVYLLSDEASDTATAYLAARHDRADVIAGSDLTQADDAIATVLLDLARQETEPRSLALARHLVDGIESAGAPMNNRPLRKAGFSVLKSADIPSVLLEVGFLSSERDLQNIQTPEWRQKMVAAIASSILAWRDSDAAQRDLLRQ